MCIRLNNIELFQNIFDEVLVHLAKEIDPSNSYEPLKEFLKLDLHHQVQIFCLRV